jgi:putative transposase
MSKSFIHEMPLITTCKDEREIDIRLNMGGYLFNAVLKEALKRIDLIKQSKLWQNGLNFLMKL